MRQCRIYCIGMHTVIETPAYLRAAKDAGMTGEEMSEAVDAISADPEAGVIIAGTGGFRKLRLAGRGKGKSGGYRLITYFAGENLPVLLITVFSKGEKANLSKAERNALAAQEPRLMESLRRLR